MGALLGLMVWAGFMVFFVYIWCRIVGKTGYHPALGILILVPVVNIGFMAFLAFKEWPIQEQLKGASLNPSKPLFVPVIVLIVLGASIIPMMLLAAIAIPNLLRAKMFANDALAKATLRAIATASESYATANNGSYPDAIYELTTATPPYLNHHYCDDQIAGYSYTCNFDKTGYKVIATPLATGSSGSTAFTIVTGGILTPNPEDNRFVSH